MPDTAVQQLAQNSAAEIRRSYNKRLDAALDKIVRSFFPELAKRIGGGMEDWYQEDVEE